MRALIITNGEFSDPSLFQNKIPKVDFVICADGGIKHVKKLGIKPDLIVGDFDSVSPDLITRYEAQGIEIKRYPSEKDYTDTQIAVDEAIERGASEVIFLGALGTRFDHSYANLMLLYRLLKRNIKGKIMDSHNTITMAHDLVHILGKEGQIVSLLPWKGDTHIRSTRGLKYPLRDYTLELDFPLGVSNILVAPEAVIEIEKGWLIVIESRD